MGPHRELPSSRINSSHAVRGAWLRSQFVTRAVSEQVENEPGQRPPSEGRHFLGNSALAAGQKEARQKGNGRRREEQEQERRGADPDHIIQSGRIRLTQNK